MKLLRIVSRSLFLLSIFAVERRGWPQEAAVTNTAPAVVAEERKEDPIARIRDEGLNHSQVMQTLSYLTDVIGPRLTGSPNLKRANQWTHDKLAEWGLINAHLEPWGPFGRGWSLKRFSAQVIEPQGIPLAAFPKAWSSGTEYPISGNVVHLNAKTDADLEKYKGNLKGAIVLVSAEREVKARFEPFASRMSESNLLRMANAGEARTGFTRTGTSRVSSTNAAVSGGSTNRASSSAPLTPGRVLTFLMKERAGVMVSASSEGDAGTLFVSSASIP